MRIIGIDAGTTCVKIIEYEKGKIKNKFLKESIKINETLDYFLKKNKINIKDVEKIVITGINSNLFDKNKYKNIKVVKVNEFEAIGRGAILQTTIKQALVVSIGTGTAFVKVGLDNKIKHIGGTGIGGGTLKNLCKYMCNINCYEDIIEMSKKGNLKNIDLTIGDVCKTKIKGLPENITLSNFGKLKNNKKSKKEDIVLAIINMIFEIVAMMAAFANKNEKTKEVIMIGNIVSLPQVEKILKGIEKIQDIKFIIPKETKYSTALGAIEYLQ